MSDQDSSQEKTEEPTEEKLRKAREDGQLARSKELQSAALVLGGGLLLLSSSHLGDFADHLINMTMGFDRRGATDSSMMIARLTDAFGLAIAFFLPILFIIWLLGGLSGMIPGGMNYSLKAMTPQAKRMNPLSGLKKMFSSNTLIELLKSVLKVTSAITIAGSVLWSNLDTVLSMNAMPLGSAISEGVRILSVLMLFLGAGLLAIAIIDVPYQLWSTKNKLKMTNQEVKDENKDKEGSPELKQRIREVQTKISQRKINKDVPEADVVIVNPTHYSVALKYDPETHVAPVLLVKGVDEMAFHIRHVAERHEKPVLELPELTRAVYHSTKEYEVIPEGLYTAMAHVLRYVMELNAIKSRNEKREPASMPSLPIPESLKQ